MFFVKQVSVNQIHLIYLDFFDFRQQINEIQKSLTFSKNFTRILRQILVSFCGCIRVPLSIKIIFKTIKFDNFQLKPEIFSGILRSLQPIDSLRYEEFQCGRGLPPILAENGVERKNQGKTVAIRQLRWIPLEAPNPIEVLIIILFQNRLAQSSPSNL